MTLSTLCAAMAGAMTEQPFPFQLTPANGEPIDLELLSIPGGIHVKDLGDGTCVDVVTMIYNHRVVHTADGDLDIEHGRRGILAAWCYQGRGIDSMLAAITAAAVYDGTTEPVGFIKRAR